MQLEREEGWLYHARLRLWYRWIRIREWVRRSAMSLHEAAAYHELYGGRDRTSFNMKHLHLFELKTGPIVKWADLKFKRYDVIRPARLRGCYSRMRFALQDIQDLERDLAALGTSASTCGDLDGLEIHPAAAVAAARRELDMAQAAVGHARRAWKDGEEIQSVDDLLELIREKLIEGIAIPAEMMLEATRNTGFAMMEFSRQLAVSHQLDGPWPSPQLRAARPLTE